MTLLQRAFTPRRSLARVVKLLQLSLEDIFPAIDLKRSGTRKEDLLIKPEALNRIWILRKLLNSMNPADCMDFLIDKLKLQKSNVDFLDSMNG